MRRRYSASGKSRSPTSASSPSRSNRPGRGVGLEPVSERSMREIHDGTTWAVAPCADLIGAKWTSLLVHDLSEGARRFTELEHACPGISPRTLSERLHMLEEQGICLRASYPESPPRVEYELTDKGRSMLPIIEEMRTFGHEWLIHDHDHDHSDIRSQDELGQDVGRVAAL